MPATRLAARKAKAMTKRRPINAIAVPRHCEPTGPRNARPNERFREAIHGAPCRDMDCFVASLLAMMNRRHATSSIRHRHGAQRLPLPRRKLFGLRLELTAGRENVAAARRAHRRRIAGVEDVFGE